MTTPDAADKTRLPRRKLVLALAMLIGGGVAWGITFSLAKLVMQAGVHPFGLAWLNAALGAALLLPYCLLRFGGIPLERAYLRLYVIAGTLGTALPSCILFLAAARVPAGVLAIITSMVPLFTYSFALVVKIERLEWRRLLGILLGFTAMLLIVAPEASLPERAMAAWVLLALIAPLSYSTENVYIALRGRPGATPSCCSAACSWPARRCSSRWSGRPTAGYRWRCPGVKSSGGSRRWSWSAPPAI